MARAGLQRSGSSLGVQSRRLLRAVVVVLAEVVRKGILAPESSSLGVLSEAFAAEGAWQALGVSGGLRW